MGDTIYQKGKFYNLPIIDIVDNDGNAYFHVKANDKEYLIRMFEFQRKNPEVRKLKELPSMVKDIHGDNIVFVQNFARMFGDVYKENEPYPFIVQNQDKTQVDGQFFYNVRDARGVVFKLTTTSEVLLHPQQKIYCKVKKISPDRLTLEYCFESKTPPSAVITPTEFLVMSGTDAAKAKEIENIFNKVAIFSEARDMLSKNNNQWIIKAMLGVPDYWTSKSMTTSGIRDLVREYIRLCLFLLEESKLLLSFPESERENYQEWIAKKIENAEIYSEVLDMVESDQLQQEIDAILHKIRNAGFIYRPEHKIAILIAIFSISPNLLEERIDAILDIIQDTNWSRRNAEFRKAFCLFMTYYIDTNRDKVNRTALVNDEQSNRLLGRIIRALSYLLVMTDDDSIDLQLYQSLLYHYLSYVRYNNTVGVHKRGIVPSENLIERAFQALMAADSSFVNINLISDVKQTEIFAYKMAAHPLANNMLATKSLESDTVRFTVNNDKITIAPTFSKDVEHNVVPSGMLDWHNIQIYLPNANKFGIAKNANIKKWKEWWRKVELALFTKETMPVVIRPRKFVPEVNQVVNIRVISKDERNPLRQFRYYCRIEDDGYYGEGWLDIYGVKATNGLFRYNPGFDIESFYYKGEPLLIRARINAIVNDDPDCPTFMFDVMGMLDEFIKVNCDHNDETDCRIIYHDEDKRAMLAISEFGYGVFIPDETTDIPYAEGDTVKVRLTDISQPRRIQAEVIGPADNHVDIKKAAEELLAFYCDEKTFQESDDQLAKDALSLSDDQFEPAHIQQMIAILDHKALMETDRISAYGYISIARILAKMTSDDDALRYLDQRLRMLVILEDFGNNGRVDNEEFELLSEGNEDFIEHYPLLKEKLCQIKIVDSLGLQERNQYLWDLTGAYSSAHLIGKLARLMLAYNVSDGMELAEYRAKILEQIKSLLNIRIAVPKVYSFGEEGQLKEFKTSIIFPPEQKMKPNFELQTFNILKVISGMANAYGGTLYLGVYDTGSAKGLDDDLAYFEGSKDKYKNYVRNQIRLAMGGGFNASIIEEFPDAGDKWIYALTIRPSKKPVGVCYKNEKMYFLREGASTYRYDDLDLLQDIMDERIFSDYGIRTEDITDIAPDIEEAEVSDTPAKAVESVAKKTVSIKNPESIDTGQIRSNIVNNWEDGYGVDTCAFLRINNDNTWSLLDEINWEEGRLTLAIHNKERDGFLLMVYDDGEVQKVGMSDLLKARLGVRNNMRTDKRPVFICPAKKTDALLVVYRDSKRQSVMRLDDVDSSKSGFRTVKMTDHGDDYPDSYIDEIIRCEIIPEEHHESLKIIHNMHDNSSYFTNHYYGAPIRKTLSNLGIDLSE